MKTILIFTQEYVLPNQTTCGGTGNFYKRYVDVLIEKGFKVVVFGSNKFAVDEQQENLRIRFVKRNYFKTHPIQDLLRSLGRKLHIKSLEIYFLKKEIAYLTKKLAQFIKEENIAVDIIETHDWGGYSLYLDKLNIPYVVRTHGGYAIFKKYFSSKINNNKDAIEYEAFKKANNIIYVSNTAKDIYEKTFNTQGVVINNGVNINCYNKKDYIPHSIFFFGAASVEKGFDIALEVFYKIYKKYADATLHIVGSGYENYKKKHNVLLDNHIVNYNHLNSKQLFETISKAHIFIFPSRGETFGLALCEAMGIRKTVVASNIPSFKNIITNGQNGFIANNEDEYYENIIKVFEDDFLNETIARNALQLIINNYNFEITVKDSLSYYEHIINTNNDK